MLSSAEPFASTGVVREAIDVRRFSWIRPLGSAYHDNFSSLASLFAGDPADPAAWKSTLTRVASAARHREPVHAALVTQLTRRQAPAEARANADQLLKADAVAIVTGQQAGLFGGPLYSLLKAATAIQLARQVTQQYGVPAVPVFWVDAEDHDWAEVRSAKVLDRESNVVAVAAADVEGAGRRPVGALKLEPSIESALTQLADTLAPTEFTADMMSALRRSYAVGAGMAAAYAGWIETLLGRQGLVVFESDDPSVKTLVADIFAGELERRSTAAHARRAGQVLAGLGHPPQVEMTEGTVPLFYLDGQDRRGIREKGGQLTAGDVAKSPSEFRQEALEHPERFSPNVLLRPIVQDRLFPTACYVAGPAELAYQAQLGDVYREFRVEAPLLYPRASVTLLDSAAARFFEHARLPLEALQPQDDAVLNRLLERELPAGLDRALDETERLVRERVAALKDGVIPIDATLGGAVDTTLEKMQDTLQRLRAKVIQAAKRKDDTLRRQFVRTRALAFPNGDPQERALSLTFFVNRYGLALGERLVETLPLATDKHYVLVL